jgi:hypothetical protein
VTSTATVSGTIETSGMGPLYGKGAPTATAVEGGDSLNVGIGKGGSYGGSGGNPDCQDHYFTNTAEQVIVCFV